jgi:uncharacterized protein (DUF58 family)
VDITLPARRRASTIVLQESLPAQLGKDVVIPVPTFPAGGAIHYGYSFKPTLRGVYALGPLTAAWTDPFGLTRHKQVLAAPQEIVVHPPVEVVRDRVITRMWEDPPVRPPRSKPWPIGFEFYGVRDYVPGDDLRRVVWSVVAKTGKMMVRESEQGITDRVLMLLDNGAEEHSAGPLSTTFEAAVKVAASVGVQHLKDGFSVTLLANDGMRLKALRGHRAEISLLDDLARIRLSRQALTGAIAKVHDDARAGAHLLVITPHLDQNSGARLRLVMEQGAGVVLVLVIHEESDPLSLARAAALGCPVVQVGSSGSLAGAFAHLSGRGAR